MNKKISIGVIVIILIITGSVFYAKMKTLRSPAENAGVHTDVAKDNGPVAEKKSAAPALIVIPTNYNTAVGTVFSIDLDGKTLTVKTAKGNVVVSLDEKTDIYEIISKVPEARVFGDIKKSATVSVQYDVNDNSAKSVMLNGKWKAF